MNKKFQRILRACAVPAFLIFVCGCSEAESDECQTRVTNATSAWGASIQYTDTQQVRFLERQIENARTCFDTNNYLQREMYFGDQKIEELRQHLIHQMPREYTTEMLQPHLGSLKIDIETMPGAQVITPVALKPGDTEELPRLVFYIVNNFSHAPELRIKLQVFGTSDGNALTEFNIRNSAVSHRKDNLLILADSDHDINALDYLNGAFHYAEFEIEISEEPKLGDVSLLPSVLVDLKYDKKLVRYTPTKKEISRFTETLALFDKMRNGAIKP